MAAAFDDLPEWRLPDLGPWEQRVRRVNRLLRERVHDPYRSGEKLRESIQCPECGVQYRKGRWVWPSTDAVGLMRRLCPACRRIDDDYPAGELRLSGAFAGAHRKEILATAWQVEDAEKREHPLNRIMSIDEDDEGITISTTDVHLPRRIARALRSAFGGSMSTHYDPEGCFARVQWNRED